MPHENPIERNSSSPHADAGQGKSIAILPFVNRSTDPENEYFSDGISEDIINALAKIKGLRVIARTSSFAFKGKNIDIRTIGQQLGVATILEGSVRKVKKRVRITAQLVNAQDGVHIWSKNFDRELADIFAVQDEVSLLIADQIRENFGHFELQDHLIESPTEDIRAYQLYLKGRYHQLKWNAEDLLRAVDFFQASIEADPGFSLPYFGAGLCCGINASWGFVPYEEGLTKADAYLAGGTALEQESYLSYFAKATVSFWGKWDFRSGHAFLLQSIALNPSFTDAEEGLAELLTVIGDFTQAEVHARNILQINPLSPNHHYTLANIHYLSGDFEKAIVIAERGLKIDAGFQLAIELISLCYIQLQDYVALDRFLLANPQTEHRGACRALYQLKYPDEAIDVDLEEVRLRIRKREVAPSLIFWEMYLNVYLGNHELALDTLEQAIAKRTGQLINFQNDPFLRPLHPHPRFEQLLRLVFRGAMVPDATAVAAVPISGRKEILSAPEAEAHLQAVKVQMEEERVFLNQDLSLKLLAEKLDLHPNKLSWLINERLGRNFNEYINQYRLETFKQKALDPKNSHLTLLGLAYESGFNSKTVFNSFFKKMEGCTPRSWLKGRGAS